MRTRLWSCMGAIVSCAMLSLGSAHALVDVPAQGQCEAFRPSGEALGPCPLQHTDVNVAISGFIARVTVTQFFTNPYDSPIEAVYAFPLSDRGAVDAMTMRIGDREIRGVVKEKGEAREIYEAARNAGQHASLLDQERPNIFTQAVANIMPGENIEIEISYVEFLKYEAGEYGFSFPMVVGPRYIPQGVNDASKITPPVTPKGTRAGHDISLKVDLQAGVPLQGIASELHEVDVSKNGATAAKIALKDQKTIPNRDFVLKYKVAGDQVNDAVLTHRGEKGGFFTLILQPPAKVEPKEATPKEMIFVIDASGSMSGFPIEKAKAAMKLAIENMNPRDTFNLISFAGGTGYCFQQPVANTKENRELALRYLQGLQGGGGTEMMGAIHAALGDQLDDTRLRVVCFMTDGYIGNDMQVLGAIQQHRKSARVFSFGIGNSVNQFLIENMAREGRGEAEIITLETQGDEAVKRFHERIHSPLLTDIALAFDGVEVKDLTPAPELLPDLFSAKPLVITGRYEKHGTGTVTLRGRTAEGPYERVINVNFPSSQPEHDVLASLWAREQIDALMAKDWHGVQQGNPQGDIKAKITKLGIDYSLVTQFTSFVAVEDKVVNENGETKRVEVPVEMPDGVSYEGVFGAQGGVAVGNVAMKARSRMPAQSLALAAPPAPLAEPQPVRRESLGDVAAEPRVDREEAAFQMPADESDRDDLQKLDPALQGLAAKLVNGAYDDGTIKVVNGRVQVFIYLNDLTAANVDQLRTLGVQVLSEAQSKKAVMASVEVNDLKEIAKLGFVTKITPPQF